MRDKVYCRFCDEWGKLVDESINYCHCPLQKSPNPAPPPGIYPQPKRLFGVPARSKRFGIAVKVFA